MPLHGGCVPPWLSQRMAKLGSAIHPEVPERFMPRADVLINTIDQRSVEVEQHRLAAKRCQIHRRS